MGRKEKSILTEGKRITNKSNPICVAFSNISLFPNLQEIVF